MKKKKVTLRSMVRKGHEVAWVTVDGDVVEGDLVYLRRVAKRMTSVSPKSYGGKR